MENDIIKGKYHKLYYEKYKKLPTYFDTLGRMPFEYQEKILKQALEEDETWQEITKQYHNDLK